MNARRRSGPDRGKPHWLRIRLRVQGLLASCFAEQVLLGFVIPGSSRPIGFAFSREPSSWLRYFEGLSGIGFVLEILSSRSPRRAFVTQVSSKSGFRSNGFVFPDPPDPVHQGDLRPIEQSPGRNHVCPFPVKQRTSQYVACLLIVETFLVQAHSKNDSTCRFPLAPSILEDGKMLTGRWDRSRRRIKRWAVGSCWR